jgi:hypothetical protein
MAGEAQQGRTPDQREASKAKSLGSRFRGNDEIKPENDETKPGMTKQNEEQKWIPAFAGMTMGGLHRNVDRQAFAAMTERGAFARTTRGNFSKLAREEREEKKKN